MVDCGEIIELGTDALKSPSEVGGSTLRSDGVLTPRKDEGSTLWAMGVGRGMGGGVSAERRRIFAT